MAEKTDEALRHASFMELVSRSAKIYNQVRLQNPLITKQQIMQHEAPFLQLEVLWDIREMLRQTLQQVGEPQLGKLYAKTVDMDRD